MACSSSAHPAYLESKGRAAGDVVEYIHLIDSLTLLRFIHTLHDGRSRAPSAPQYERTGQLPAADRDERRGKKVLRVDNLLRETRPVFIG
jgi:hypothetical protein